MHDLLKDFSTAHHILSCNPSLWVTLGMPPIMVFLPFPKYSRLHHADTRIEKDPDAPFTRGDYIFSCFLFVNIKLNLLWVSLAGPRRMPSYEAGLKPIFSLTKRKHPFIFNDP